MISVQWWTAGTGYLKAAPTGLHWNKVTRVKAIPAALTTNKVAIVAHRNVLLVFDRLR